MRDGWEQVSLGELTTKRVDFSPIVASTEYPVVGVQRSGWGLLARDVVRGDSMKFSKLMRLNANDLVYRVITAFEAPSTVVDASFAGSYVTPQTFPVFRIDSSRLLPGFMRLHTTSPVFHEAMSERCTGTVLRRKTISVGAFQSIPINLPPLAEQRRIVDLIGSLDKAIEEADKFGQIARDGLDAVADSMIFTKVKWPEATVHGVAEKRGLVGGPFGSSLVSTDYVKDGVPVIRGKNMPTSEAHVDGPFVFVSNEKAKSLHRNQALPGDVIFTQRGTLGQVGLIPLDGPAQYVISQSQMRLRLSELASPRFIFHVFRSARMVAHMKGLNSATANPHINLGTLAEVVFPLPPHTEQARIVEVLDATLAVATKAEKYASSLRHLRTNFLTALLSGAHEIPDSYDDVLAEAM